MTGTCSGALVEEQHYKPCHIYVPIFMKYGSLNLLDPLGSVQACTRFALSLYLVYETLVFFQCRGKESMHF